MPIQACLSRYLLNADHRTKGSRDRVAASGSSRDAGDESDVVPEMRTVLRFGWLSATIRSSPGGGPVVAQSHT